MKIAAVLTEDGAFALFFVPTPGDFTVQESPPPGICHPRPGVRPSGAGGGGGVLGLGAAGID